MVGFHKNDHFHRHASLKGETISSLFGAPVPILEGVTDNTALIEADMEHKCSVTSWLYGWTSL